MKGEIFLLQDDNSLLEMKEEKYNSEDLLQSLLEDYPNLISGSQIDPDFPRRWILVKREMGISDKKCGSNRWSIDHFFLDQDGIPTFIEVKRSTDTRIRREVIGQMLEYASNSVRNWDIQKIRRDYEDTCSGKNIDPVSHLAEFLNKEKEQEDYWNIVERNLKKSNIRLLFVADQIPSELQRIIEYLNEQMISTEVLAMEVRQYTGQNLKTLVSRVVGRTMKATDLKADTKMEWDREMLLDHITRQEGNDSASAAAKLIRWCEEKGYWIRYGRGRTVGTVNLGFTSANGDTYKFFEVDPKNLRIVFHKLKEYPPFDSKDSRIDFLKKLNEIEGISFNEEKTDTWSNTSLSSLLIDDSFMKFCEIYDHMVKQIEGNL